jgi:hypothetical protein
MENSRNSRPLIPVIERKPVLLSCSSEGRGKIERVSIELGKSRILANTIKKNDAR